MCINYRLTSIPTEYGTIFNKFKKLVQMPSNQHHPHKTYTKHVSKDGSAIAQRAFIYFLGERNRSPTGTNPRNIYHEIDPTDHRSSAMETMTKPPSQAFPVILR